MFQGAKSKGLRFHRASALASQLSAQELSTALCIQKWLRVSAAEAAFEAALTLDPLQCPHCSLRRATSQRPESLLVFGVLFGPMGGA